MPSNYPKVLWGDSLVRVPSSHARTIFLLLATQFAGLALGLALLYVIGSAVIDSDARKSASTRLASVARQLSQSVSHSPVSENDLIASLRAEIQRQWQSGRLPAGIAWLAVDPEGRVLATGRTSDEVPALDALVERSLPWTDAAENSAAEGTQGFVDPDGAAWVVAAELLRGSRLRLIVATPAESMTVPVAALHQPRMAVCAIALLWTAVLQGIALYLVLSGTLERLSKRNLTVEADNLRQAQALVRTRDALILGMATLAESRDDATGLHLDRVSAYATHLARILAREPKYMREITPEFLDLIGISAALHDIGKVGIEDAILLKPGQLTPQEQQRMRQHPLIGGRCLEEIERRLGTSNFLEMVRQVVVSHHERWDGRGYPEGLSGTDIPLAARIVGLTDVYDAMCSTRAYKNAMSHDQAVEFIRSQSGIMFDPEIVDGFLLHETEFHDIARHYRGIGVIGPFASKVVPPADSPSDAALRLAGNPARLPVARRLGRLCLCEPRRLGRPAEPVHHILLTPRSIAVIEPKKREQWIFESFLVIVCLGLAALLYTVHGYWIVVLNLFFLPVALAGFYLGRYRAGVLALLCVLFASTVTVLRLPNIAASGSPLVAILAVAVWAAVLGLAALLIGTLSDERADQLRELHEAYVGVVEVLSQYLQSAHPRLKAESIHVAELSQEIAEALRLSLKEIDDIRIASLLYNVGNIEITTKVIRRAVDLLEDSRAHPAARPLQGLDLMVSLGTVLSGAVPLLLCQGGQMGERATSMQSWRDVPLGVQIIRAARAYVHLSGGRTTPDNLNHLEAVGVLRSSYIDGISPQVFDALQRVVQSRGKFLAPAATTLEVQTTGERQ